MKKLMLILGFLLVVILFGCEKQTICWECKTWNDSQHPASTDPVITYHEGWTQEQITEYVNVNTVITMDTIQGQVYHVYHKETRCKIK